MTVKFHNFEPCVHGGATSFMTVEDGNVLVYIEKFSYVPRGRVHDYGVRVIRDGSGTWERPDPRAAVFAVGEWRDETMFPSWHEALSAAKRYALALIEGTDTRPEWEAYRELAKEAY